MGGSAIGWLVLALVWMAASLACGAALALLYKRLHPSLAFYKLWALWSMVLSGIAALWFALAGF